MRVQNYQTISSNNTFALAARKTGSSETSFQDVLAQKQDALMDVDASAHFCSKISDSLLKLSGNEISSALADKIAEIQASIDKANAADGYPVSESASSEPTNSQTSSVTDICSSSAGYNEGNLRCSDELNAYFLEAASTYNLDVKFLKAVAFTESSFRADATSKCGAMGIMQLMPSAAKQYGAEDPYDARQNILAGAKILSTFLKRYDGDKELTLAAYNAGPGNVKKSGGVPEYTRYYINKVLKYYNE